MTPLKGLNIDATLKGTPGKYRNPKPRTPEQKGKPTLWPVYRRYIHGMNLSPYKAVMRTHPAWTKPTAWGFQQLQGTLCKQVFFRLYVYEKRVFISNTHFIGIAAEKGAAWNTRLSVRAHQAEERAAARLTCNR